jgi:ADP-ribose pyrophosphatase YjhB (NUDIX family)
VAAAVVREDGKVLVIQRRDNGHWEPPGGVLEPGETLHSGLVREVEEETGYLVEPGPLTGVYQNMERDIIALVFRCALKAGTAETSDESRDVAWLDPGQLAELMSEAYAVRLLDALEQSGTEGVRTHDGNRLLGPA